MNTIKAENKYVLQYFLVSINYKAHESQKNHCLLDQ